MNVVGVCTSSYCFLIYHNKYFKMWLKDEVLYPRFLRSLLWMILLHYVFVNGVLLFFKIISWHPFSGIAEWLLCIFHWRTFIHLAILSVSIIAFGALNLRLSAVEKHINSTRFEKICRAFSPYTLQHFFCTMALGGLVAYCYDSLFHNFRGNSSFMYSWLFSSNEFEQTFVIGHGCFIGIMFSLKYFICNAYLIKFSLDEVPKIYRVERQTYELIKDSFYCVFKSVHWYYLAFIIFGSPLKLITFSYLGNVTSDIETIIYNLLNPKLFILCSISGTIILFTWNMYLDIFNAFSSKHHKFPIKVLVKREKDKTLHSALACEESSYLKYLAAIDLRLLAQFDSQRRQQVFAISHPGGHPHEWKAISGVCINLLQDFLYRLNEYSFAAAAASDSKTSSKVPKVLIERIKLSNGFAEKTMPSLSEKILCYFREKPTVSYFFDELPNSKLIKLFAPSQPYIWIIDALGYLVSASYIEDTYGVVQQTLPEIIRLLLDIKMAEEKMPAGLVGIRTYVKDPQGRYDHVHQRISLRNIVNNALCRIANTFNQDINGIYLPEEYQKYFQRYLGKKN